MNTNLINKYIDYINELRTNSNSMMIVYDSFKKYLEKSVSDNGIDLAIIPNSLISIY